MAVIRDRLIKGDAKNSLVISATIKEVHEVILAMLVVFISSSIAATTAANN